MEVNVFLDGCIIDGVKHGDIVFSDSQNGLNGGVHSSFTKNAKELRTYYLCFDFKKTPKKQVLATLTMILKQFNLRFLVGHQYSFSRDFVGPNDKVVVYAYGNDDKIFHFFISSSEMGVCSSEYLAKNHQNIIFENL